MDQVGSRQTLITYADLQKVAVFTESRFQHADTEETRMILVRRFLASALALHQSLRLHTRCALVNHCGTIGQNYLEEITETLFAALEEYEATVKEIAASGLVAKHASDRIPANGGSVLRVV